MTVFSFELETPDPVRLGLIILQADETIERMLSGSAAFKVSRCSSCSRSSSCC